jgi:hypothetical protein
MSQDSIVEQNIYFNPNQKEKTSSVSNFVLDKVVNNRSSSETKTNENNLTGMNHHLNYINSFYRRKMQLVCILCFLVLTFSQVDTRFTS